MMKEYLKLYRNQRKNDRCDVTFLSEQEAEHVKSYHESFPPYRETPLVELRHLSEKLGVRDFFVKDESSRFGLNAFKVLGGSYAIGKHLAAAFGFPEENLSYQTITSSECREKSRNITFISTTDGNHGRGVAWTAHQLGCNCIIHMPAGSASERLENIRREGACADITAYNYDDSVRMSAREAEENGYVMVQDTAWEGYEDIPRWIMQGYLTMAYEAYRQLQRKGMRPTHIFVQAGVGSLAGAVTGFFRNVYPQDMPVIAIVEPNEADCIYRTASADDGELHAVTGRMKTMMAGLACGEPCTIAWPILSAYADYFVSCPDYISAKGMRVLSSPLEEDARVVSGESGAVGVGLAAEILQNERLAEIKKELRLDEKSIILCFSTEGATDKKNYYDIVWDGLEPSC